MKLADLNGQGFKGNRVLEICKKHVRYISAGAVVLVLVLILAATAGNKNVTETGSKENGEEVQENVEKPEAFKEDAISEINTLIENYYTAYAAGDIATIETYVTPISDIEKSYITLMSQYIKAYTDVKCYTKAGLAEGEYAVSVVMNMSFENAETSAPGLDFFYIRKNTSGAFYIDNLYSQFNLQNQEQALDSQVEAFIEQYELQEDVVALCSEVEERYAEAMAADENLKNIAETLIPQEIQKWVTEITGTEESQTQEEEVQQDETQTQEEVQQEVQEIHETVYVTENVNIRQKPEETAEKVGSAIAAQEVIRTGITDNGWSRIEYDGGTAYIKSEYLSTEKPAVEDEQEEESNGVNYVPEGIEITMNNAVNVRKTMEEDGERIGTTEIGDKVEVILSYAEGWTKVKWNDKTGYIKTEILLNN